MKNMTAMVAIGDQWDDPGSNCIDKGSQSRGSAIGDPTQSRFHDLHARKGNE